MSDQPEKTKLMTEREAMRLILIWMTIAFMGGIAVGIFFCVVWTRILA